MRKPEVLSAARAAGLNKEVVSQWFNQYESLLVELGIEGTLSHIWNCDESGLQDQFSSTKVVGQTRPSCEGLKHHWDQEGRKWTRMMAGQKLSRMEFFPVFSRAWAKAATVKNAQAGFRGTGMFPLNKDVLPETAFAPSKTTERVLPSTLPSLHTRPQCLLSPPTRPPPLPPLPTGPWSPLLTLTHSAHQPLALLSGHQPSHPPARPQSPADLPARPQSASLTPLLPVEPLYFFPDEKVVFEEVFLEEVPEEDTDLFNAFTPQEETHSQDEEPSTSTGRFATHLFLQSLLYFSRQALGHQGSEGSCSKTLMRVHVCLFLPEPL
ncbi:unnamed protein product [Merluccius merluccius]